MAGVREQLLNYYERELTYIRQMSAEFAQKYPKLAGRLLLEPDRCEDPHVERLLEGFALLAARVHLKINDDFPEISTALLESLYPHYIRPIPSMSVVQFQLDPKGKTTTSLEIPKGSPLLQRVLVAIRRGSRELDSTGLTGIRGSAEKSSGCRVARQTCMLAG